MRIEHSLRTSGFAVLSLALAWTVAACTAPSVPAGLVEGRVTESGLFGVSGVVVRAQGQTTLTDADGRFTLEGIAVPYDLSLSQTSGDGWLHVIEGLTDRAPVVDPVASTSIAVAPSETDVSGTLSGGVWPLPAGRRVVVCVEGLEALVIGCETVSPGASAYALTANLLFATSADVRLHGLRILVDADGRPTGYEGYGFADVTLVAGVPAAVPLALGAAPVVDDLQVAFDVPGGAALSGGLVALRLGDRGTLPLFSGDLAGDALTLPVPVLPDARYAVLASAVSVGGNALRWSVVDGLDAGTLAFPVVPQTTTPLDGATGVTEATAFAAVFAGPGPRTFHWTSGAGPELAITTTRASVTLPDPLAAGLVWPAGATYSWNVIAHDAATVDAAVATLDPELVFLAVYGGVDLPETGSVALTDDRSFILAP